MTARAAVADGRGGFAIEEIEVAAPGPQEVRVDLRASGICHTDLDAVRTTIRPFIMGHEGAGVVSAVGSEVDGVAVGDPVLLTWAIACGTCFQCVRGNQVLCENYGTERGHAHHGATTRSGGGPIDRFFTLGTMSTATLVRREAVVPLPRDLPLTSACLLGCAVMTGYGSVVNAARVRPGSSVVVIGCGGVGLNVIQAARIAGAADIVAVDVDESRFEMARRLGATETVLAHRSDTALLETAQRVIRTHGGRGCDYAFECTGVPSLGASPLAFVRNGGVAIQVSGVEQEISIDMTLFEWDKTFLNPLYGKARPAVDYPILFDLYRRGLLILDELVTRRYELDDLPQALADLEAGRNAKGVLTL